MSRLRIGTSYWLDQHHDRVPRFRSLRGRHEADVAIVGGGVTGCVAANLFARSGARVVLIEAQRIGRGSTAASTALLMQEPDVDFRDLAERYGKGATRRIWMRSRRSVRGFTTLLQRLRIAAALRHVPSVYWTRDPASAIDLRRELAARHRAGLAGRWLSPDRLHDLCGLFGAGAIVTEGNAEVDPYRACLGLAEAAVRGGALVCERTAARRITTRPDGIIVDTGRAEIRAGWAIVATGYATAEFKPLAGRFRMSNTYVVATPALPPRVRRAMGRQVMWWDTERPYHYVRWTPDGRLLFGGGDRPRVPRATRPAALARRARDLAAQLAAFYPALEGVEPEYAWEGLFATTPDGLPYIGAHRRYPRHLFALGYGGNGMTFGYLAAETLVRAVRGTPHPDDALFAFGRSS